MYAPTSSSKTSKVRQITVRYPVGRVVTVYYDPSNPKESVLEPGVTSDSWTKAIGGIIFLLIAVGVIIFSKFKIKKKVSIATTLR
jgi:hypothetical protein